MQTNNQSGKKNLHLDSHFLLGLEHGALKLNSWIVQRFRLILWSQLVVLFSEGTPTVNRCFFVGVIVQAN